MDDFGILVPFGDGRFEVLEFFILTCIGHPFIRLNGVQCHDLVRLCQVLRIDVVVTQLVDVLRVIVIVLGIKVALNSHVGLKLLDVGIDILLQWSPLVTSWTMRFAG